MQLYILSVIGPINKMAVICVLRDDNILLKMVFSENEVIRLLRGGGAGLAGACIHTQKFRSDIP